MSLETTDTPAPNRRLRWFAAAGAVGTVVLVAFYFLVLRQDYAVLLSGVRPQDAAAIVDALEKQSIPYRLAAGGSEIRVPADRIDTARIELASSNVVLGGSEGFELFNESDMGLTDFAQKIRYQRALQGELARTIMMMEGVADARVHVTIPERALFRAERRNAEAAVTLVMRRGEDATPQRIEGVQRLVAAAVPDLLVSDVVVLNSRGEIISPRVEIAEMSAASLAEVVPGAPAIDTVLAVMRQALPERRFEVAIEPAVPDLAGADAAQTENTPFLITVTTANRLGDTEMESVSTALRTAGFIDGESNGTLQFRIAPPSSFEAPVSQTATAGPAEAAPRQSLQLEAALPWIGLGSLIVLGLALLGALAWFNRPILAPDEQEAFAQRLREVLQSEPAESRDHV